MLKCIHMCIYLCMYIHIHDLPTSIARHIVDNIPVSSGEDVTAMPFSELINQHHGMYLEEIIVFNGKKSRF